MYCRFFKRLIDLALSILALLVLSPLFVVLTVAGAVAMRGNPFFSQLRPGKGEKLFRLYKFRTMLHANEHGKVLTDEERLTKYGRFLRRTSLDELPQLLNIIAGNMAIVGPRPQLVRDMVFMSDEVRRRHSVRPGLTGLAQCNGRNDISWESKFAHDLEYVDKLSLKTDLYVLFRTFKKVAVREGIGAGKSDFAPDYGEYLLFRGEIGREEFDEKIAEAKAILEKYYR